MSWKIEYSNDTGPDDEGFWEWWCVTDGVRSFKADSREDAYFLLSLLNATPPQQEQAAPGAVPDDVVKDAERYRWLRGEAANLRTTLGLPFCAAGVYDEDGQFSHNEQLGFEQMDASIDAAMLKEGK